MLRWVNTLKPGLEDLQGIPMPHQDRDFDIVVLAQLLAEAARSLIDGSHTLNAVPCVRRTESVLSPDIVIVLVSLHLEIAKVPFSKLNGCDQVASQPAGHSESSLMGP